MEICGETSKAGTCTREPGHTKRHKYTKEDMMETATMSDAEAIETLVRTDETHLSDEHDDDGNRTTPEWTPDEGQAVRRTQGQQGMFHVLSEIDDGVFVAWDRCHNTSGGRHGIHDCTCKGGPTEPPYVTKWRSEWLAKKGKAAEKALKVLQDRVETPVQTAPSMGAQAVEAALEAVEAATSEEETHGSD